MMSDQANPQKEWPWSGEIAQRQILDRRGGPSLSLVIPNFNGGRYLERALRSILLQDGLMIEVIVIDGGSTDNSVDIIRRYEPWISYWVSERDRGQTDALNKGFSYCKSDIINWLCSDDILTPGAASRVIDELAAHPDIEVLVGQANIFYFLTNMSMRTKITLAAIDLIPISNPITQPACFFRKQLLARTPPLCEKYHYAMDFELWAYFKSKQVKWRVIDAVLCEAVMTGHNKCSTGGDAITSEMIDIYGTYVKERVPLSFWYQHLRLPLSKYRYYHAASIMRYPLRALQILVVFLLGPFYGFKRVRNMCFWMPPVDV